MESKSGLNPRTDLLIINDLQKSFLQYGELENFESEKVAAGTASLLSYFLPRNVYLFYHHHFLEKFEDPKTRHSIIYQEIGLATMEGNEVIEKSKSERGKSLGAELEPRLAEYQRQQQAMLVGNSYFKSQCPLLGENFSVIQHLKLDEIFLKRGIKRIFFCGLNLDPCIKNEVGYLLIKKQFEILIFEDLVRSYSQEDHYLTIQNLKAADAKLIKISDFIK